MRIRVCDESTETNEGLRTTRALQSAGEVRGEGVHGLRWRGRLLERHKMKLMINVCRR